MDKLKRTEQEEHQYKLKLWTQQIRQCRASGMTVKQWCAQNGYSMKTYYYWMRRIKRELVDALPEESKSCLPAIKGTTSAFAKVVLSQEAPATAITIRIGSLSIGIMDGTSDETIRTILSALKSLC